MEQLILHLFGDYVAQSGWMANNKTKRSWPALAHALVYSLPFLLLGSLNAFAVICVTHFFIDRFRLARYMIWLKDVILSPILLSGPEPYDCEDYDDYTRELDKFRAEWAVQGWANCSATGYPSQTPSFLAVWLMIACDNTMHLAINYAAIRWL